MFQAAFTIMVANIHLSAITLKPIVKDSQAITEQFLQCGREHYPAESGKGIAWAL